MSETEIGILVGGAVIFLSFLCAFVIICAAIRSGEISRIEEKQNEQDSSRLDQGDY